VRVGRAALDEDAIRLIEASNPDVQFDWTRILKGQPDPDSVPAQERRAPRPERDRQTGRSGADRRSLPRGEAPKRDADVRQTAVAAQPLPVAEPIAQPEEPTTAAHARLGSEGLARLRARYAETLARITERIQDADQQAQLKGLAERLNPDAWVTDDEVSTGLESYEVTFEELRGTIGNRRRAPRVETNQLPQPDRSES
jgi:hypothetical protein